MPYGSLLKPLRSLIAALQKRRRRGRAWLERLGQSRKRGFLQTSPETEIQKIKNSKKDKFRNSEKNRKIRNSNIRVSLGTQRSCSWSSSNLKMNKFPNLCHIASTLQRGKLSLLLRGCRTSLKSSKRITLG